MVSGLSERSHEGSPLPLGEGARRAGEGSRVARNVKPSPGASRRPLPEGEVYGGQLSGRPPMTCR